MCRPDPKDESRLLIDRPFEKKMHILSGIFSLFPDVERPIYADETEEEKLGKILQEILAMN
jgi:hypothetical protein